MDTERKVSQLDSDVHEIYELLKGLEQAGNQQRGMIQRQGNRLDSLEANVAQLADDAVELKMDMAGVRTDLAVISAEVTGLVTEVGGIRADVSGVRADLVSLQVEVRANVAELGSKLDRVLTRLGVTGEQDL